MNFRSFLTICCTVLPLSWLASNVVAQSFTPVTSPVVINPSGNSGGVSWGDFNGDKHLDFFVANATSLGGPSVLNDLLMNNGDGTFSAVLSTPFSADSGSSIGSTWGDYDNDGDLDLFVANAWNLNPKTNFLYRNDGAGTFTSITTGAIVTDTTKSNSASWGDYDNDGYLDLFVANTNNENNSLYHNNGNGTFTKIITGDIVNDGGNSFTGTWADYDNDGFLDLFVTNVLGGDNFLYNNNGDGTFTKITTGDIVNDGGNSFGGSWGDSDNDMDLDLFVTSGNAENPLFYENNGNGTFTKITTGDIVSNTDWVTGSSWVDFDNDGDLDLFAVTFPFNNNLLYSNNGDGTFTEVTAGPLVTTPTGSFACAWADYDRDGALDVVIASGSDNHFFRNLGNFNNFLQITLEGVTSNKSAIGARVKIKSGGTWQMQEVSGQTGLTGQNSLNVEFGMDSICIADSLLVEWPVGGTQTFTDVASNQFIEILESATTYTVDTILVPVPSVDLGPDMTFCDSANLVHSVAGLNQLWSTGATDTIITVDSSGFYWIEVWNDYQCGSSDTIELEIDSLPVPAFSFSGGFFGEPVTFVVTSDTTDSLSWAFGDGDFGSFQDSVHFYPTCNCHFVACLTASNSCGQVTVCDSVEIFVGAVEELANSAFQLKIWPNPAVSSFSFEMPTQASGDVELTITDAAGRVWLDKSYARKTNTSGKVNIELLPPGVYVVQLESESGMAFGRLIKH